MEREWVMGILVIAGISFLLSFLLTPLMRIMGLRMGVVDSPEENGLKIHKRPIPRMGGGAILMACMVGLIIATRSSLVASYQQISGIIGGGLLVFGVGLWDDVKGVSPGLRLFIHLLAGLIIVMVGIRVRFIPFTLIAIPLTLFYIVGAINAVNIVDGMDGLAGGLCGLACLGFIFLGLLGGENLLFCLSVILFAGILGFLPYNFHPAKIFLGDAGSGFLGFLLGVMMVSYTSKPYDWQRFIIPILILAVPVIDMALAIIRRVLRRKPLSMGDRSHSYDLLLKRGLSQRRVWSIVCGAQAILIAACLFFVAKR